MNNMPQREQPGTINITLNVATHANFEQSLNMNINPEIPFKTFIVQAMKAVFAQEMPKSYDENVMYIFGSQTISQTEERTLKTLGFIQNSVLKIVLKLKGG